MTDICIIGGGAAGMAAAICAKETNPARSVLILEKKNQLGKKLLATGNGRCNLSNAACPGSGQVLDFFHRLGVWTRTDEAGRVYPYTEEARAVQEALLTRIQQLGIEMETSAEVISVEKPDAFRIHLAHRIVTAKKVLIACGGKAGPSYGSTGDGFRFARDLGHQVEKLVPVLTAVDVQEDVEKLAGIRVKGIVALERSGEVIFREAGEIQFTRTGISGICVFNLSRFLLLPAGAALEDGFADYRVLIDFFPEMEADALETLLAERQDQGFSRENLLRFLVRAPIAEKILAKEQEDRTKIAALLKAFPLSPKRAKGWDFAQATKGGVALDQVDRETMESKLIPGLYFAGEVLDYDGPCGGYNLQHAWESGMRAGKEMGR